jgi:hypothetical protein
MYPQTKHNEYWTFNEFINNNQSQFCHEIELKRTHITLNDKLSIKLNMKTCKKINSDASSSTLEEDLASHDKRNHKRTKLLH